MKQHIGISGLLLVAGLSLAFSAFSHPFDSPLTFRKHITSDGRIIYSNIQKRCFSNGKLTCLKYHPIWKGGLHATTLDHNEGARQTDKSKP